MNLFYAFEDQRINPKMYWLKIKLIFPVDIQ